MSDDELRQLYRAEIANEDIDNRTLREIRLVIEADNIDSAVAVIQYGWAEPVWCALALRRAAGVSDE